MPWIAFPLGVLTGVVMGALGAGGAILTIPVLVFVLGHEPHTATTESLVIVGASALVTALGAVRRGTARVRAAALLALAGLPGTYAGSVASAAVSPSVLLVLLAALLVVVAGLMLRPAGPDDDAAPGRGDDHRQETVGRRTVALVALGFGVGALTGFFGVGGGFAIVPALTLVLRYPIGDAVGTSLLVIALNSTTALAVRLGQGVSLDWPLVGGFTLTVAAGSILGARLAWHAPHRVLTRGFATVLLLIAAYQLLAAVLRR
ncbi:MAG: sulfite exporter TauE/SafE family protein [Dermatophilaceae bacterium]